MTETVKSGCGRLLDVDVFVYGRFNNKRFDWIIFGVLDKSVIVYWEVAT